MLTDHYIKDQLLKFRLADPGSRQIPVLEEVLLLRERIREILLFSAGSASCCLKCSAGPIFWVYGPTLLLQGYTEEGELHECPSL